MIEHSTVKKAVMFESCIFMNNGNGTFKIYKLPVEAQFSPVRDILVKDIDKDGKPDLVLVGNDYAVRFSYGRYDASYGWFLTVDSTGKFKTMIPVESGLIIKGDARKILPIKVSGKHYIVVAINNGELQVFQILK